MGWGWGPRQDLLGISWSEAPHWASAPWTLSPEMLVSGKVWLEQLVLPGPGQGSDGFKGFGELRETHGSIISSFNILAPSFSEGNADVPLSFPSLVVSSVWLGL